MGIYTHFPLAEVQARRVTGTRGTRRIARQFRQCNSLLYAPPARSWYASYHAKARQTDRCTLDQGGRSGLWDPAIEFALIIDDQSQLQLVELDGSPTELGEFGTASLDGKVSLMLRSGQNIPYT